MSDLNEANDISLRNSAHSQLELNSFIYYDTARAWDLLKEGIIDCEPDYFKFSEIKMDPIIQETDSVRSLPEHKIPYINNCTVKIKY